MPPDDRESQPKRPRFLLDQNVQDAVLAFLAEQGYEAVPVRDVSGADAPDSLIAFIANSQGLVLITHDHHFRRLSRLLAGEQRRAFEVGAGTILLPLRENRSVERLRAEWRRILFMHEDAQLGGVRFHCRVTETGLNLTTNARIDDRECRSRHRPMAGRVRVACEHRGSTRSSGTPQTM